MNTEFDPIEFEFDSSDHEAQ
ncbi:antitoxin, partial [Acinetobacter baumannii]